MRDGPAKREQSPQPSHRGRQRRRREHGARGQEVTAGVTTDAEGQLASPRRRRGPEDSPGEEPLGVFHDLQSSRGSLSCHTIQAKCPSPLCHPPRVPSDHKCDGFSPLASPLLTRMGWNCLLTGLMASAFVSRVCTSHCMEMTPKLSRLQ